MADKKRPGESQPLGLCYGRVSTREQADTGHGIAAQRKRAETYCELIGIAPGEWIADQGRSGSLAPDKRPGLARALALLADGEAHALVVPALDRLARNTRDILEVADRAQAQQWRAIPAVLDAEQYLRASGDMRPQNARACRDALAAIELDDQAAQTRTAHRNNDIRLS